MGPPTHTRPHQKGEKNPGFYDPPFLPITIKRGTRPDIHYPIGRPFKDIDLTVYRLMDLGTASKRFIVSKIVKKRAVKYHASKLSDDVACLVGRQEKSSPKPSSSTWYYTDLGFPHLRPLPPVPSSFSPPPPRCCSKPPWSRRVRRGSLP